MKKSKIAFLFFSFFLFHFSFFVSGQTLCVPSFTESVFVYIDNFAVHTLVNSHSSFNKSGSYTSYPETSFSSTLSIGKTYPITISSSNELAYGSFAAWVDYNNDSTFENSELIHYDAISHYSTSGFVTVPNDTNYIGKRRLRIIYSNSSQINPCGNYNDGEGEDYIINIVANQLDSQTYCMPFNPANMTNFRIDEFRLGSIVNDSSGSNSVSYTLYPANLFSTNLDMNTYYPLYIKKYGVGNTGGFAIWIDLDNDGDFSSLEKLYSSGSNLYHASGTILIPTNQSSVGLRRLRVRSKWGVAPTEPCGLYGGSETEDYFVNITSVTGLISVSNSSSNFSVFPNPTNENVNLVSNKIIEEIKITNLIGETIDEFKPNQKDFIIHFVKAGIYYIQVLADNKITTQKLIVTQ